MKDIKHKDLPPSVFTEYPWNSICQKTEAEIVAQNIMVIRARLGDRWKLPWQDYRAERLKDGHFTEGEREYFDKVMPRISDATGAIAFCATWALAARRSN